MGKTKDKLYELVEETLWGMDLEIIDLEYRREPKGWVVRVFIDKEKGVTLDECSWVSREIEKKLDAFDILETAYTLEVSSPGLDRPLRGEKDFVRFKGRLIRLNMYKGIEGNKFLRGILVNYKDDKVIISVNKNEIFEVPFIDIAKARLEVEF